MIVYCPYAEEFEEGEPCHHTGLVSCVDIKQICPMIETGYATIEYEDRIQGKGEQGIVGGKDER